MEGKLGDQKSRIDGECQGCQDYSRNLNGKIAQRVAEACTSVWRTQGLELGAAKNHDSTKMQKNARSHRDSCWIISTLNRLKVVITYELRSAGGMRQLRTSSDLIIVRKYWL